MPCMISLVSFIISLLEIFLYQCKFRQEACLLNPKAVLLCMPTAKGAVATGEKKQKQTEIHKSFFILLY